MSLTVILKERPDVVDFLVSRIKKLPKKPMFERKAFSENLNYSLIGTAFDYAFRFEILRKYQRAKENQWIAKTGAFIILLNARPVFQKWKKPASGTIELAYTARNIYYSNPNKENLRKLVEMCFRLSHLDRVYRQSMLPSSPVPKESLMPAPLDVEIDEVITMLSKSKKFINSQRFAKSKFIELNPSFSHYSGLLGGADADIITSTSLIDLKTYLSIKIENFELAQIVGYYMLIHMCNENPLKFPERDLPKFPTVKEIGMFFPRFAAAYMISCDDIPLNRKDFVQFIQMVNNPPKIKENPLEKLKGVGYHRSKTLNDMGIKTVEDLANMSDLHNIPRLINGISPVRLISIAKDYINHWLKLKEGVSIEIGRSNFDFDDEVYLDIETTGLSNDSQIWLIGLLFKSSDKLKFLVAHESDEEKDILKRYLKEISKVNGKIVIFSGRYFDKEMIEAKLRKYKLWYASSEPQFADALNIIRETLLIPVSNNLKDMATWMGYKYRHPELSGSLMPLLYNEYLFTQDKDLLGKLIEYNEDDLRSLKHIVNLIRKILSYD